MVAGSARNWIAVHAVNNPTSTKLTTKNITTLPLGNSISRSLLRRGLLFIPLVLCCFALSQPPRADATTTTWICAGTTGDWFNPANWSNGVPNSSKDALINNGGQAQINSFGAAAHFLTLGLNGADSGTLAVDNGGLGVTFDIYVGNGGTGTLTMTNGARVECLSAYIAASTASHGSVTVSGSSSIWQLGNVNVASSRLFVGGNENEDVGTALLSVTNGGTVTVYNNSSQSSVIVGSSGTLTGNGTLTTLSEPTVVVLGTLAPSSGTLSLGTSSSTSNLFLRTSATTACNVTPLAADNVDISGTATVAGRLSVTMTGTFTSCGPTRYTLLHSTGVRSGFFLSQSITYPTNQGFTPHITYDGNHVYLDLVFNHPCG
jgi:T5SS/PEP-CTERM-associated repeat protein